MQRTGGRAKDQFVRRVAGDEAYVGDAVTLFRDLHALFG